jgi:hypothetical protein
MLVVGSVVSLAPAAVPGATATAGAATTVPYTDPSAQGYIGLCNQAGQQITSGSIDTTPMAWRAVSSVAAPAPYDNAGRTAILQAFQPLDGLPPGDWSGQQMTASSRYSNPSNPMAAATDGDNSLADFLTAFPARWEGFVQLRMYLGTVDQQPYELHYPVLDLQVTGDTWTAVDGGPVNCSSGTAESIETILLPKKTTASTPGGSAAATSTTGAGTAVPPSSTPAAGSGAVTSPSGAHDPAAVVSTSHPANGWLFAALAAALVAAAGGVVLVRRRRLATSGAPPDPDRAETTPTKGQQP